jgi:hypothetical protein
LFILQMLHPNEIYLRMGFICSIEKVELALFEPKKIYSYIFFPNRLLVLKVKNDSRCKQENSFCGTLNREVM